MAQFWSSVQQMSDSQFGRTNCSFANTHVKSRMSVKSARAHHLYRRLFSTPFDRTHDYIWFRTVQSVRFDERRGCAYLWRIMIWTVNCCISMKIDCLTIRFWFTAWKSTTFLRINRKMSEKQFTDLRDVLCIQFQYCFQFQLISILFSVASCGVQSQPHNDMLILQLN